MERKFKQIKEILANLPDKCQLIEEYAEELLTDEQIEEAESYLKEVYSGDVGVICLVMSSNCAAFLFLYEDQPEMVDSAPELLDVLSFEMFSADEFEDLDDKEKEEVEKEAQQILEKSLAILKTQCIKKK